MIGLFLILTSCYHKFKCKAFLNPWMTLLEKLNNKLPPKPINTLPLFKRNDIISKTDQVKYTVLGCLGKGTYGHVYKVLSKNDIFAIKVLRSETAYYKHGLIEIRVLDKLANSRNNHLFVSKYDSFIFNNHLCIVQECLDKNLYEVLQFTNFVGFDHLTVKKIANQILQALETLNMHNIVHCDLKPENILLSDVRNIKIKLIDFGNAMEEKGSTNFYVQSRYYRSPEVILGMPYDSAIDIWSFGCIICELFIGYPLFPGKTNNEQINRIKSVFQIPQFMLDHGIYTSKYKATDNRIYMSKYTFQSKIMSKDSNFVETSRFLEFLLVILKVNPFERPNAFQCRQNPYINGMDVVIESKRKDSVYEIERNQPNPHPTDEFMRSMSITDMAIHNQRIAAKRKKSAYERKEQHKENRECDE